MTEFYKYQVIIIQRIEKGINVEKMLWIIMLIENDYKKLRKRMKKL
jgi:hypothetical protein